MECARPKRAAAPTSFKAPAHSSDSDASDASGSDADSESEPASEYEEPADDEGDDDDDASDDADFRDLEDEVDDADVEASDDDDDASLSGEDAEAEVDEDGGVDAVAALLEDASATRDEYTTAMALIINHGQVGSPSAVYKSACAVRTLARAGALRALLADASAEFVSKTEDVRKQFLDIMMAEVTRLAHLMRACNDVLSRRGRRLLVLDLPDAAELWINHLARTMPPAKKAEVARNMASVPTDVLHSALGAANDDAVTLRACSEQFRALLAADPEKDAFFIVRNVLGAAHVNVSAWVASGALSWSDVAQMRKTLALVASSSRASSFTRFGRKLRNDPPSEGYVVVKFGADLPSGYVMVVEHIPAEAMWENQHKLHERLMQSEFPEVRDVVATIVDGGRNELIKRGWYSFEFVTQEEAEPHKVRFVMRRGGDDAPCLDKKMPQQGVYQYMVRKKALVCDNMQYRTSLATETRNGSTCEHRSYACALTDFRNKKARGVVVTDAMRRERKEALYEKFLTKMKRILIRPVQGKLTVVVRTAPMPPRATREKRARTEKS